MEGGEGRGGRGRDRRKNEKVQDGKDKVRRTDREEI